MSSKPKRGAKRAFDDLYSLLVGVALFQLFCSTIPRVGKALRPVCLVLLDPREKWPLTARRFHFREAWALASAGEVLDLCLVGFVLEARNLHHLSGEKLFCFLKKNVPPRK